VKLDQETKFFQKTYLLGFLRCQLFCHGQQNIENGEKSD